MVQKTERNIIPINLTAQTWPKNKKDQKNRKKSKKINQMCEK